MKGKTFLLASAAVAMIAVSAGPASAAEWWENTKISGRMYYDMTNLNQTTHTYDAALGHYVSSDSNNNGFSFDIKRFYVSIDHKFNNVFSADITTDTQYLSSVGTSEIYIKKAYLQAKLSDALTFRLGSADMPWIPFVEGVYGYRYVENTLIDRTHYGSSADWGVYSLGKLANGLINYEVAAVNGAGYKKPIRTDGIDFEGRVNLNYKGFVAAIGGYTGKLGAQHNTSTSHTANRVDALLAYAANNVRVGVEYFNANDWHSVLTSTHTTDNDEGYSVFASYQFTPEWGVFGRYDWVTTKTTPNGSPVTIKMRDNYYNAGIAFTPYKMIDFALVYKHQKNDYAAPLSPYTDSDEVGVWGRLRW